MKTMLVIMTRFLYYLALLVALNACSRFTLPLPWPDSSKKKFNSEQIRQLGSRPPLKPHPEANPTSYEAFGNNYHVRKTSKGYQDTGYAAIYPLHFDNYIMANGKPLDMYTLRGASRTLPIPCYVKVTNLANGQSVVVRITDRGPFASSALIRLSPAAAHLIDLDKPDEQKIRVKGVAPYTTLSHQQFYIRVASFTSEKRARQANHYLKSLLHYHKATVLPPATRHSNQYVLAIGPFRSRSEASAYLDDTLGQVPLLPRIIRR